VGAALWERLRGRYQRDLAAAVWRRPVRMRNSGALISFTFDDFPRSSLDVGGAILRAHGVVGTYYVSLGLMDRDEPVGRICSPGDVGRALAQGHELGCHTFGHCDAWGTAPRAFEESILQNRRALTRILPGADFETMSYPIGSPRPGTKRRTGRHFLGCRGGGQSINFGMIDLNHLRAFFLEQSRDRPGVIREMIDRNRVERGWLIFVTHDVRPEPSRFGCTPWFFGDVVQRAMESGAKVLPVARALAEACGRTTGCASEDRRPRSGRLRPNRQ
jgi:peptidoglycan/xylan/chitin deacetylase (PgdA/CDA1 family)